MNITILVGNGFDKNLGLDTDYKSFYKVYKTIPSKNKKINEIKEKMNINSEEWGNLEMKLGQIASDFSSDQEGLNDYYNFCENIGYELRNYLKTEDDRVSISRPYQQSTIDDFVNRIVDFPSYIMSKERNRIKLSPSDYGNNINLLIFNYTKTIDKIFAYKKRYENRRSFNNDLIYAVNLHHVHGYHDNDMVFGVNDPSQISNPFFVINKKLLIV